MRNTWAESLTRGTHVIVQGRLKQRSFETRDGEKRTVVELDVDEIGSFPPLRHSKCDEGEPRWRKSLLRQFFRW